MYDRLTARSFSWCAHASYVFYCPPPEQRLGVQDDLSVLTTLNRLDEHLAARDNLFKTIKIFLCFVYARAQGQDCVEPSFCGAVPNTNNKIPSME